MTRQLCVRCEQPCPQGKLLCNHCSTDQSLAKAPPRLLTVTTQPLPETIFERMRARLSWSQAQLAEWFGVTEVTVWRWENARTVPPALHARVAWKVVAAHDPSALLRLLGPAEPGAGFGLIPDYPPSH